MHGVRIKLSDNPNSFGRRVGSLIGDGVRVRVRGLHSVQTVQKLQESVHV